MAIPETILIPRARREAHGSDEGGRGKRRRGEERRGEAKKDSVFIINYKGAAKREARGERSKRDD